MAQVFNPPIYGVTGGTFWPAGPSCVPQPDITVRFGLELPATPSVTAPFAYNLSLVDGGGAVIMAPIQLPAQPFTGNGGYLFIASSTPGDMLFRIMGVGRGHGSAGQYVTVLLEREVPSGLFFPGLPLEAMALSTQGIPCQIEVESGAPTVGGVPLTPAVRHMMHAPFEYDGTDGVIAITLKKHDHFWS